MSYNKDLRQQRLFLAPTTHPSAWGWKTAEMKQMGLTCHPMLLTLVFAILILSHSRWRNSIAVGVAELKSM